MQWWAPRGAGAQLGGDSQPLHPDAALPCFTLAVEAAAWQWQHILAEERSRRILAGGGSSSFQQHCYGTWKSGLTNPSPQPRLAAPNGVSGWRS